MVGDRVASLDHGTVQLNCFGRSSVSGLRLAFRPELHPIRIKALFPRCDVLISTPLETARPLVCR